MGMLVDLGSEIGKKKQVEICSESRGIYFCQHRVRKESDPCQKSLINGGI